MITEIVGFIKLFVPSGHAGGGHRWLPAGPRFSLSFLPPSARPASWCRSAATLADRRPSSRKFAGGVILTSPARRQPRSASLKAKQLYRCPPTELRVRQPRARQRCATSASGRPYHRITNTQDVQSRSGVSPGESVTLVASAAKAVCAPGARFRWTGGKPRILCDLREPREISGAAASPMGSAMRSRASALPSLLNLCKDSTDSMC